ncbi:MAG: Rdx family protein [Gemmatimonadaceae bacterium]|nr:Rdx family protein [Gemmatimonadaceae bacterium]
MAAEIRAAYPDAQIEMIPSRGGRFEVTLDGTPIFEKSKLGRHARSGEVLSLIKQRARGAGGR